MRRIATIAALLLSSAAATAGERAAELTRLPEPAGLGRLLRSEAPTHGPLVIMLPDALGEDGRSEIYADALLARGISSLVLDLGEDADTPGGGTEPAAAPAAVAPALRWASEAGFDPARIGLLGFGLGGRAAIAGSPGQPVVALYPTCRDLPEGAASAQLVLQGGDEAAGCDVLPAFPGRRVELLPGAGHAWDAPGAIWPSPGPVLPDPAGAGRLRAHADLSVTLHASEMIADWFEDHLLRRDWSARR